MSHQHFLRQFITSIMLTAAGCLPLALIIGCGSGDEKNGGKTLDSNATTEDRRLALKAQLADMQLRLTELEQRTTDLQEQQNRALEALAKSTTRINKEFVEMKSEALALASGEPRTAPPAVNVNALAPSDPAALAPPPTVVEQTPRRGAGSKFLVFFLWAIVIIAIGFFVKLFIARKDEEFDDFDQAEQAPDVKLNEYGSVQMPRDTAGAAPSSSAPDDDPEHAGRA